MSLERVVVYVDQQQHQLPWWEDVFRGTDVAVTQNYPTTTDAALTSVLFCERFGCRAGITDDTLGRMYVFDSADYGEPDRRPRIYISNAIWRKEPPLLEAIRNRLHILSSTLADYGAAHPGSIRSLMIHTAVLGMWKQYTHDQQLEGIRCAAEEIKRLIAGRGGAA